MCADRHFPGGKTWWAWPLEPGNCHPRCGRGRMCSHVGWQIKRIEAAAPWCSPGCTWEPLGTGGEVPLPRPTQPTVPEFPGRERALGPVPSNSGSSRTSRKCCSAGTLVCWAFHFPVVRATHRDRQRSCRDVEDTRGLEETQLMCCYLKPAAAGRKGDRPAQTQRGCGLSLDLRS